MVSFCEDGPFALQLVLYSFAPLCQQGDRGQGDRLGVRVMVMRLFITVLVSVLMRVHARGRVRLAFSPAFCVSPGLLVLLLPGSQSTG